MTDVGMKVPSGAANAFAVTPELAADAFRRISALQDVVGAMVRQAKALGRQVPLGSGYAGEIGEFMARYGLGGDSGDGSDGSDGTASAVESLTRFGRELEQLKEQISMALRRYEDEDDAAAGGVDCSGG